MKLIKSLLIWLCKNEFLALLSFWLIANHCKSVSPFAFARVYPWSIFESSENNWKVEFDVSRIEKSVRFNLGQFKIPSRDIFWHANKRVFHEQKRDPLQLSICNLQRNSSSKPLQSLILLLNHDCHYNNPSFSRPFMSMDLMTNDHKASLIQRSQIPVFS